MHRSASCLCILCFCHHRIDDASATALAFAPPLRVPCDASDTRSSAYDLINQPTFMLVPLLHLGLELDDASTTALALAPPLRVPCDASDTRPRSLCDTPAHKTATDILSVSYPTDSYATPLGRLLCIRLQQASMACVQIQGCYSTRHTPSYDDQCALHALLGSSTEDRS